MSRRLLTTITNTGAFTKVDTIELHNEQHELIRTLDVNEYDLNMRDLSTALRRN
jgi:hypothetical protein